MRLWSRICFAAFLPLTAAACDSAEDVTPESTFAAEDPTSRTIGGRVLAGTEPVAGALVHVDVHPGFASDALLEERAGDSPLLVRTMSTNSGGAYRFQFAPQLRDMTFRAGRELLTVRALGVRTYDAPLAVEAAPSGFVATVIPTTNPPAKAGNAIAYFVSGPNARALAGAADGSGTFAATFRQFETTITLHAVEYDARFGPAAAVAQGFIDVPVRSGQSTSPVVPMSLVPATATITFEASPPPGYALQPLDIEMDFGLRTNARLITRVAVGAPLPVAIVGGARYFVRGRAVHESGAFSDTGRAGFDPNQQKYTLTFPPPISLEAPVDDDAISAGAASSTVGPITLDIGGTLAARLGKGVVEHVVAPESGAGPVVRVVTAERTTTLPDPAAFGLARPTGRHRWTVQHWSTLTRADQLSGEDGRIYVPSWTSGPRVIVVR